MLQWRRKIVRPPFGASLPFMFPGNVRRQTLIICGLANFQLDWVSGPSTSAGEIVTGFFNGNPEAVFRRDLGPLIELPVYLNFLGGAQAISAIEVYN